MWKSAAFSKRILRGCRKHRTGVRWQPSPAGPGGNRRHLPGERAAQGPRRGHPYRSAAVADDSGLIVDVMGNAPGILSARWAGAHGHDKANNALLLAQIEDIPDDKRTARFRCAAALVVPDTEASADVTGGVAADGITVYTTAADGSPAPVHARYAIKSETVELGDMPGRIIREARGEHGFGYDPLFVPDDQPAGRVSTEPDHEGEPLYQRRNDSGREECDFPPRQGAESLGPRYRALLH